MLDYIKMNLQLFAAGTLVNATTTYVKYLEAGSDA